MGINFDYDAPLVDVTPVVDAIRAHYRLPELSQEEKEQRRIDYEIRREEQAWRDAERQAEHDRQQQEREAAARHEAAIALAEANRKARLERQERDQERQREQQLVGLHIRANQQEVWQSNVEAAARIAVHQRQQQALLADLENHFNPPPPQPEPEVIHVADDMGSPNYFDDNYNPKYYHDKFWGKFGKA